MMLRAAIAGLPGDVADSLVKGEVFKSSRCPVLDATGNPLIEGNVYRDSRHGNLKFKSVQYGQGNIMDTYYYVYLDKEVGFDDVRLVVEQSWTREGRIYQSELVPV